MKPFRLIAALGILIVSGFSVRADFVAQLTSVSHTENVAVNLTSSTSAPTSAFPAGRYDWTWQTGSAERPSFVAANNTFSTFCIELTQSVNMNTNTTYTLKPLAQAPSPGTGQGSGGAGMGTARANMLQELIDKNYSASMTNHQYAALQLAIWEIVFEGPTGAVPGTLSLTQGNGVLSVKSGYASLATDANTYLSSVTGNGNYSAPFLYRLQAISSGTNQDQLVITPNDNVPPPVPVPAGAILLVSGLPILGLFRRVRG